MSLRTELETEAEARAFRSPTRAQVWIGVAVAAGLAAALVAGIASIASSAAAFPGGGWHGARHRHDPEDVRAHVETGVEWLLRWADATDAQQAEARGIAARAADALLPLGERHREHRDAWVRLLTAETVDRAALEQLRQQELALAEEASRALLASLADVADVLSPAQRVRLAELAQRFHHER